MSFQTKYEADPFLEQKYIQLLSVRLNKFKRVNDNTYNSRCPLCGDSEKNKRKARFYFWRRKLSDGFAVSCHNCGYNKPFWFFLKKFDANLYGEFVLERFKKDPPKATVSKPSVAPTVDPIDARVKTDKALEILTREGLISDVDDFPAAKTYLEQRKIPSRAFNRLYVTPDFNALTKRIKPGDESNIPRSPRILFPLISAEQQFQGFQGRIFDAEKTQKNEPRYLTVKLKNAEDRTFGMELFDNKKLGFVVEGALDSLFLHNSIAISGGYSNKLTQQLDKEKTIFALDNEPRNAHTCAFMEKAASAGFQVCVWPSLLSGMKDINEMVLAGHEPEIIDTLIRGHSYKGIEFFIRYNYWKRT